MQTICNENLLCGLYIAYLDLCLNIVHIKILYRLNYVLITSEKQYRLKSWNSESLSKNTGGIKLNANFQRDVGDIYYIKKKEAMLGYDRESAISEE